MSVIKYRQRMRYGFIPLFDRNSHDHINKEDIWRNTLLDMNKEPKVEEDCGIWAREGVARMDGTLGRVKRGAVSCTGWTIGC